jgi:hypothetical protein
MSAAAYVMDKGHLQHLPILDAERRPLGLLAALDVARWASAGP